MRLSVRLSCICVSLLLSLSPSLSLLSLSISFTSLYIYFSFTFPLLYFYITCIAPGANLKGVAFLLFFSLLIHSSCSSLSLPLLFLLLLPSSLIPLYLFYFPCPSLSLSLSLLLYLFFFLRGQFEGCSIPAEHSPLLQLQRCEFIQCIFLWVSQKSQSKLKLLSTIRCFLLFFFLFIFMLSFFFYFFIFMYWIKFVELEDKLKNQPFHFCYQCHARWIRLRECWYDTG